jgi:Flp pilus assembly protein TadD
MVPQDKREPRPEGAEHREARMTNIHATTRAGLVILLGAGLAAGCGIPDEDGGTEAVLARADSEVGPPAGATAIPVVATVREPAADSGGLEGMPVATYEEALSEFRRGRYAESARLFTGVAAMHPADGQTQYMLGLSAWKSGDRGRAVDALTRAVELDGGSVKARTNLSRVLLEQGRAADALPHMEAAIEQGPDGHEVWRVLGNVYSELGRSDDALESYRLALVRNPEDAWSMNNYGLVLIRLGRYEDALPALARAVELVPGSPVFRNNLGVALERTGHLASAANAFTAALEADSTYVRAATSLERVRSTASAADDDPVDLDALARDFTFLIEEWGGEGHYEC